jgi:hypothetical protein
LQFAEGLASLGDLRGGFFQAKPVFVALPIGGVELFAKLAYFAVRVGLLLRRVMTGRAGLILDRVELPTRDRKLLDELFVLGPAFFKLAAEGGDFVVAAEVAVALHVGRGGLKLLGKLADAQAQLGFDLGEPAAMLVQRFVGALSKGAQFLRGNLSSIARGAGPRLEFFHEGCQGKRTVLMPIWSGCAGTASAEAARLRRGIFQGYIGRYEGRVKAAKAGKKGCAGRA